MGEIVRLVIVQCVNEMLLFEGEVSEELGTQHRFYTKYVSEIETYVSFCASLQFCNFGPF